jgi:hypothetical protein
MFGATEVITVDVGILVDVAPVVIVPLSPWDGANVHAAPIPKVPPNPGFIASPELFVIILNLFNTAAEIKS